jgi:broad specificity phosphatase PhoE
VYCSPLRRAWWTAVRVADALGLEVPRVDGRLTEADLGRWSDLTWPEVERRWPEQYRAFEEDAEQFGYPGGEDLAQVRDRALPGVSELADRHRGETIAVVSHGVVLRVLLAFWMGLPLRYARRVPHDNGGFSVVELDGGAARVRTVNAVRHLAGLLAEAA